MIPLLTLQAVTSLAGKAMMLLVANQAGSSADAYGVVQAADCGPKIPGKRMKVRACRAAED